MIQGWVMRAVVVVRVAKAAEPVPMPKAEMAATSPGAASPPVRAKIPPTTKPTEPICNERTKIFLARPPPPLALSLACFFFWLFLSCSSMACNIPSAMAHSILSNRLVALASKDGLGCSTRRRSLFCRMTVLVCALSLFFSFLEWKNKFRLLRWLYRSNNVFWVTTGLIFLYRSIRTCIPEFTTPGSRSCSRHHVRTPWAFVLPACLLLLLLLLLLLPLLLLLLLLLMMMMMMPRDEPHSPP